MPRILRIINRFNLGGPTYNAAYLTKFMAPEFETMLVGGQWDETEAGSGHILNALDINPIIIPEMRRNISVSRDRAAYKRIKAIIEDFKPDIVHTHASKAGAVGRLAATDCGVPAIVHTFHGHVFHSYFGPVKTNLYKNIERFLAKRSTRIVAISERQKEELVLEHRICSSEKVEVIPLGFDLDRFQNDLSGKRALFRQIYGLKDEEIAIGIIGRLVPIKDHTSFLQAIDLVRQRTQKKIRVFIVGDGEERTRIENTARELGLSFSAGPHVNGHGLASVVNDPMSVGDAPLITFTSWLKEVDIVNAGLDIVALSSLNEGTPVSLIEAQAANKPIVSTRVGGIENVVLPGKTALLSPPSAPDILADNLMQVIENSELRRSMAKLGWEHVSEKFHYSRLVDDMSTLYRSLLS
jgi:glycosyltransferase involved in cell wall biosynthesis